MSAWQPVQISSRLYENVDETSISGAQAALENAYVTEANSLHRFPGLALFADLGGNAPVYLSDWKDDLIGVTGEGAVFRCDQKANAENVTDVPVSGGRRVDFTQSSNELIMAAGGPIIRFAGEKTERLSKDAPNTTSVGYVDNYTLAIEPYSGRFYHSNSGDGKTWDALDVYSADSKPDNLLGLFVTPYREILLAGKDSIEQFERLTSGEVPFYRRWTASEGTNSPYTMTFADNAVWFLNAKREFVRLSGQVSQPASGDIGAVLEKFDERDFDGAWATDVHIEGQKFILLQLPNGPTPYGGRGLTYFLDYKHKKWSTLYGWDEEAGHPAVWPGVSYKEKWGRHFVGGHGKIYELKTGTYSLGGKIQRMMGRTSHFGDESFCIDNLRLKIKRGVGTYAKAPEIMLRCRRDNKSWGKWVCRNLGKSGQNNMNIEFGGFGCAFNFQFEWAVTDDCSVEIKGMDVQSTGLGW